jgi:hypothetical protein
MVLTASFALSPVIGLSCHRHRRKNFRQLDAGVEASGPHDFTVRVSTFRQARRPRPPHPTATFVTIAGRPSFGSGGFVVLICPTAEAEYFRSKTG